MDDALPQYSWIRSPADVPELERALAGATWVALDTESNSYFVYRERVCLLQLNVAGELFLLDPLAFSNPNHAIQSLRDVLENPRLPLYMHGAEYDVAVLKREFDLELGGVLDSQQAAAFLGWPKTSYQAVVENICGVVLPKAHSQYDWSKRPLDDDALRYALDDVVHLPAVAECLAQKVADADLTEEVQIANESVMAAAPHRSEFDPARVHAIKGAKKLGENELARLFALYLWRDAEASRRDVPPGRLVNNERLIHIARRNPSSRSELERSGLQRRILRTLGDSLHRCLEIARNEPPTVPPLPRAAKVPREIRQRESALKKWRREEAERREVPLQVVLPARALAHIAKHGVDELESVPELGSKRLERYGGALRDACT